MLLTYLVFADQLKSLKDNATVCRWLGTVDVDYLPFSMNLKMIEVNTNTATLSFDLLIFLERFVDDIGERILVRNRLELDR